MRATLVAVAAILVAGAPFILGEGYHLHLLITSAIFAILGVEPLLDRRLRRPAFVGHAAFFGIGAYTSALLYLKLGIPMWGGIPAAMLTGAASAFLIGIVILRVRGYRFVITTLAFTEIMRLVVVNRVDLTRGQMGLPGIRAPSCTCPAGEPSISPRRPLSHFVAVAGTALCVAMIARIVPCRFGWGLLALRENEQLGESTAGVEARSAMY